MPAAARQRIDATRVVNDTIAAPATPPGEGGIGVVRVSGPAVVAIAQGLLGTCPQPRRASYRSFRGGDGEVMDHGIALFFPGPDSFTGEDVLELQGHGGPVVLDRVLNGVLALGARVAEPGEFSQRAFLNGRIDLPQAEAIADLISSRSVEAARSAIGSLEGAFSHEVEALAEELMTLRARTEALLDFPDEEVETELTACGELLSSLADRLQGIRREAGSGRLLAEGLNTVIIGAPNAGKSSLMNALTRRETAIVTDIPGTTRDILRESITLGGIPIHLMDTAGIHVTTDPVERAGIERAEEAIARADLILEVVDDSNPRAETGDANGDPLQKLRRDSGERPWLRLYNKTDCSGRPPGRVEGEEAIALSAHTGAGIDVLAEVVSQRAGYTSESGRYLARRRHIEALNETAEAVERAQQQWCLNGGLELVADDLKRAHASLGRITGRVTSEDILGAIFSEFCIGK